MAGYTPKEWVKDNPITNAKLKRLKELIDSIAAGGTVDTTLSTTSVHAVQNKAITTAIEALENGKQNKNKYYTLEQHPTISNTYVLTSGTIEDIYNDFILNKNTYLIYNGELMLVSMAVYDDTDNSYACMASTITYDVQNQTKNLCIMFGIKDTNIDNYFYLLEQNLTADTTADATSDNLVTNRAITTYVNNSIFGAMSGSY